ncbi:MAG: ATP synthase F1 subunit gamma [Bacteroidia bacterium]|nr:ATP synthase F1 subunit gamma [Bacteroidia bacterium]MCZ2249346.1 ATP synthase F1 subunit gamma [Bacteroidia bacterium]
MANLKEVRNRIASVTSTQQITKAMKMVSAAKLRKAQDAIVQMRPYANKLQEILQNVSSNVEAEIGGNYAQVREVKNVLLVVVTSNRGLCGAFNMNVIKRVNYLAKEEYKNSKVSVLCIGKKANDFFKKTEYKIVGTDLPKRLHELFDNLSFDNVAPVAEMVMKAYVEEQFDRVDIVYNKFKNAAVQEVVTEQFLPIVATVNTNAKKSNIDYIFEPDKVSIVTDLIPKSLKIQFYKTLLDSHASEHGARMTAMHKATDNAGALIKELKLSYNKARQAAITNEILEIVGGAEALKG